MPSTHVDNFSQMCDEMIRVVKPGGEIICSFNMFEPPTACEPHTLTEDLVKRDLLDKLETISYRISDKGPRNQQYEPFFRGDELIVTPGEEAYLWVLARKK